MVNFSSSTPDTPFQLNSPPEKDFTSRLDSKISMFMFVPALNPSDSTEQFL